MTRRWRAKKARPTWHLAGLHGHETRSRDAVALRSAMGLGAGWGALEAACADRGTVVGRLALARCRSTAKVATRAEVRGDWPRTPTAATAAAEPGPGGLVLAGLAEGGLAGGRVVAASPAAACRRLRAASSSDGCPGWASSPRSSWSSSFSAVGSVASSNVSLPAAGRGPTEQGGQRRRRPSCDARGPSRLQRERALRTRMSSRLLGRLVRGRADHLGRQVRGVRRTARRARLLLDQVQDLVPATPCRAAGGGAPVAGRAGSGGDRSASSTAAELLRRPAG